MRKTERYPDNGFAADLSGGIVSLPCRWAELLLNCARIGFNP